MKTSLLLLACLFSISASASVNKSFTCFEDGKYPYKRHFDLDAGYEDGFELEGDDWVQNGERSPIVLIESQTIETHPITYEFVFENRFGERFIIESNTLEVNGSWGKILGLKYVQPMKSNSRCYRALI